jgi:acetoacetyl-CoA synthetase
VAETTEGIQLWEPSKEFKENARISDYMNWLGVEKDLTFEDYNDLWEWSVTDLEGFWASVWEYGGVEASQPYEAVLAKREMPGAEWFPGARLNYAENILKNAEGHLDEPAIMHQSEVRSLDSVTWNELRDRTAALAAGLRAMGVERGDRVAA